MGSDLAPGRAAPPDGHLQIGTWMGTGSPRDCMGGHLFPTDRADRLEDDTRYRYLSRDELLALLDPDPEAVVADLGSGTGFYADDVCPYVNTLVGLDLQPAMHAYYRGKGTPENVQLVLASAGTIPIVTGGIDAAMTIMTFHEIVGEGALTEIRRILVPGGRFVIVDWSASGEAESGPPLDERFGLDAAVERVRSAGFSIERRSDRAETFVIVAIGPEA